jgi:hypothetical protein
MMTQSQRARLTSLGQVELSLRVGLPVMTTAPAAADSSDCRTPPALNQEARRADATETCKSAPLVQVKLTCSDSCPSFC